MVRDLLDLPSQVARLVSRSLEPLPPGFPPGPSGDSAVALGADPLAFIVEASRTHGDVVGLKLAGEYVVLVGDPAVARDVLVDRSALFVKEGTAFFPGSSLAGEGLLVSDGDAWARQRRLSNPAFRAAAVETYADAMSDAAARLLRGRWRGRGVRDAYEDFNDLTLEIVADALFGADVRGADAREVNDAIKEAFEFFAKRSENGFIVPEWVPTPDNARYAGAVARLDEAVYAIIDGRRRARRRDEERRGAETTNANAGGGEDDAATKTIKEGSVASRLDARNPFGRAPRVEWDPAGKGWVSAGGETRGETRGGEEEGGGGEKRRDFDLLDRLLDARDLDGDGGGMSDESLRDELMTLMVAGQETSAILLSWCVSLLAAHPEAARRCAEEANAAAGGASRNLSAKDFKNLPYLEAVVLETMRLYPPAYMVGRCCSEDVVLDGRHELPKGTTVLVSPYLLHRDARLWDEPDAFAPERWLAPGGEPKAKARARNAPGGGGGVPGAEGAELGGAEGAGGEGAEAKAREEAANEAAPMARRALSGMGPGGAYAPFGAGPRNCIGTGFAMMEAVLVLAAVTRGTTLKLKPGAEIAKPRALITLRPDRVEIDVETRDDAA